ncbi:hypothetical protein JCM10213_006738 [Rhodosporidiobolus nylandii]
MAATARVPGRSAAGASVLDPGYASTSGFSLGGISTREPLRSSHPPHRLLSPLRSLLTSLNIPISPSSLAIVTPSLLLTVLEALLETRIEDVPDEWRGSWSREHRRGIVDVLVRAIDEVVEGLTRALDGAEVRGRLGRWRAEQVDVEEVVRGKEDEVAKLVAGLLEIAEAMGVSSLDDGEETVLAGPSTSTPYYHSPDHTPRPYPHTSVVPPSPDSSPFTAAVTSTPSTLFAPRPLHPARLPDHPHPPSRRAPSAFSASTTSAVSGSSALSHHSASTSLTVPSHPASSRSSSGSVRPSLLSELSKSGTLSPPPGSPRRLRTSRLSAGEGDETTAGIRTRSTLELMRRLKEERERERERARQDERAREQSCHALDAKEEEREAEERRRRKGKGKERELPERADLSFSASSTSSTEEGEADLSCEACGAALCRGGLSPSSRRPPNPPPPQPPRPRKAASAAARLVRADDPGELSVHGESEIEAFERLHLGHSARSSGHPHATPPSAPTAPPPASAAPQPSTPAPAHPPAAEGAETPSPYQLMLLAQRDRLKEKLAALQRRERDRQEAGGGRRGEEGVV